MLKYTSYTVVFQEVPDEVSLAFEVSGCPFHCKGCHSPHLWDDVGAPLLAALPDIVERYAPYITCVCFMGGTQNIPQLCEALQVVKVHSLKTCVYAGNDDINEVRGLIPFVDYLKVGSYQAERGPLNNPNTNQAFYQVQDGQLCDKTYLFHKGV